MGQLIVQAGSFAASNAGKFLAQAAIATAVTVAQRALLPDQNVQRQGSRLQNSTIVTSNEGTPIANVIGRSRIAGQIIWQTTFREEVITETESQGGKGGPSTNVETTTYNYYCSFAIGLCVSDGSARIGQIWADGKPMTSTQHTLRFYDGSETQSPDPRIVAVEGRASAYRGLCYLVFDERLLEEFGNRIPQITVEVINIPDE